MKLSRLGAETVESGNSFHSEMVLGKNECLYVVVRDAGTLKHLLCRFWWPEIMFCVSQSEYCFALICLLLFSGVRYTSLLIAGTLPFWILYKKHSLFSFLLFFNGGRFSSFCIFVTDPGVIDL